MKRYIKQILGFLFTKMNEIYVESRKTYQNYYFYKHIKKIGKDCKFNGISYISGLDMIEIGDNVHIGNNAFIRAEGGLYIGDNVHFSRNTLLYTMSHNYEGEALPYDSDQRYRPVRIEKNVWIGMNVSILPGTIIREGAIVGGGAVVYGEIEAGAIVGNSSMKTIKKRDMNHYNRLESAKKYGGVNGKPYNG
jgi:chloramphenicol O-acetyltransferase type B